MQVELTDKDIELLLSLLEQITVKGTDAMQQVLDLKTKLEIKPKPMETPKK